MRTSISFFLLGVGLVSANLPDVSKVVGYVGPACVVVDDLFYLHGHFIRRLHPEEILSFKRYQNTLSLLRQLRDAVAKGATLLNNGSISLPNPVIPEFCNGFDDTVEVVLDGCTVRGGHVYVADRLVRPINIIERQRINLVIAAFAAPPRQKRSSEPKEPPAAANRTESGQKNATETPPPPSTTTEQPAPPSTTSFVSDELKELISSALNIHTNITERFLPVAQMSPLFQRFLAPNEQLFAPREDDPQAAAFAERPPFPNVKLQKRSGFSAPPTEIPHLVVDERTAGGQPMGGQPPAGGLYDPLLIQLLQSLAARQQNINEIMRQQQMIRQSLQQNQMPPPTPAQPLVMPPTTSHSMKAGDKILIGGQPYLVVQLNPEAGGAGSLGLVPVSAPSNSHLVTATPPHGFSNGLGQGGLPTHYGPNAGMTFGGYGQLPLPMGGGDLRLHPGRRPGDFLSTNVPLMAPNGVPYPHSICQFVQ